MQCCQQQRARALFGEELAGAATGAADELRGGQGHRDHHRQVGAPLLGPLVLQLRRQLRDRRLANELAVAVDRPRRDAACGDLREQRVHLARRHIGRGAVAERGHDLGAERSRPTAVRRAGLRQRVAVLAQRRRLGVSHMLEPVQVRVGDLAEGDRRVGGALPPAPARAGRTRSRARAGPWRRSRPARRGSRAWGGRGGGGSRRTRRARATPARAGASSSSARRRARGGASRPRRTARRCPSYAPRSTSAARRPRGPSTPSRCDHTGRG